MNKLTDFICKHKALILIITLLLLVPTLIGIKKTKINYDILVYLPDDIETIKGQNILTDDFKMGAFSISIIDNMDANDVLKIEEEIKKVKGVNEVASLYDAIGTTIPIEMLPSEVTQRLAKKDSSLLLITFKDGTSEETTLNAVEEIRKITKDNVKVGGMSAMVLDTMDLSNKEIVSYVVIAVILCLLVLMLSLDSYVVPILLLLNIGIAILFNMGTNVFLGNISYITKAISAVLQLGVTTDFSIFLYHKYENAKKTNKDKNIAMKKAINETITSVTGSSLTTIAGFLALCFMTLTLGKDIGIVMAKGVLFGLICVIIVFPALLLIFDNIIEKTTHKVIIPSFKKLKEFVIKRYKLIFVIFLLLLIPAYIGQKNTNVYYNLDRTLPSSLDSSIANKSLKNDYKIVSPEMILVDKNLSNDEINDMIGELKNIKGIDFALSYSSISDIGLPLDVMDSKITSMLESDKYKMIIVNSVYDIATDKLNSQITKVNDIVKKYDKNAIVAGEGPLMKDLVEISDTDFRNVNYASIIIIVIIMLFVLKSYSLPVLLISAIEFAIFVNMSVPYYTNTSIPFIASIVIGTIQLGATIDYAILMTTKYLEERKTKDKFKAIKASLDSSVSSIFVSGMCFFAATFGVGIYSKLEMIGSLCTLISRGAIISMIVVIMVLPSILIIFDKLIYKTTKGFKEGEKNMKNNKKIKALMLLASLSLIIPVNTFALTKDETVYAKIKNNGDVKNITVTDHLINDKNEDKLTTLTNLDNIKNLNGKEKFTLNNNQITWNVKNNKDIYYSGTSKETLPVTVSVTYKLNGNEMKPKKMLNKKGNVEITYKFTNNDKHYVNKKNIYTPFTLALTTSINTKNNKNVTVTNGKVISTGVNNVIAAVSAPGLYESLNIKELKGLDTIKISYETTKFSLNSVYVAITPKVLDSSDLDNLNNTDEIFNKVNTLKDAASKIVSGSNELKNGLESANNGTKNLNNGAKALSSGSKELNSGINDAYNGTNTIKSVIDQKIKELESDNTNALDEETLNSIANSAKDGATLSNEKKALIGQGAINAIKSSDNYKMIENRYMAGLNEASEAGITEDIINICASGNYDAVYEDTCKNALVVKLINAKQMMTIMQETAKLTAIQTASSVSKETAKEVAYKVSNDVANKVKSEATKQTTQSLKVLKENLSTLTKGLAKLNAGSIALVSGTETLENGTNSLVDGSNKLLDGANNLYNGLNEFNNNGILKISNIVNNNLKGKVNTLKDLKKLSDRYNSYTLNSSNTKSSTKFIYLIDGISK